MEPFDVWHSTGPHFLGNLAPSSGVRTGQIDSAAGVRSGLFQLSFPPGVLASSIWEVDAVAEEVRQIVDTELSQLLPRELLTKADTDSIRKIAEVLERHLKAVNELAETNERTN